MFLKQKDKRKIEESKNKRIFNKATKSHALLP